MGWQATPQGMNSKTGAGTSTGLSVDILSNVLSGEGRKVEAEDCNTFMKEISLWDSIRPLEGQGTKNERGRKRDIHIPGLSEALVTPEW